jgi:glycosyltransferase involved in cell wall biosynthesis
LDSGEVAVTQDSAGEGQGQRLRIAYLLQQFPVPTETFVVSDIAALVAQGHDVSVYTVKWPPKAEQELLKRSAVPESVPIHRPSWAGVGAWPKLTWQWRRSLPVVLGAIAKGAMKSPLTAVQALLCIPRVLEIADQVVRSDFDVVHSFWSRHSGLVLPALKARHSRPLRTAWAGAYDIVADDFLVDATLGAAEIAFSHAEVNRAYLERKADPSRVAIIWQGIPLVELGPENQRKPFEWITTSSLDLSKNVEGVIRAFALARERQPKLRLRILGDGPDRPRLENIVRELGCSEAVAFAGHVPRDEVFAQMQRASAFLIFSKKKSERLPNVVKEALWAGCTVVSSNTPGIEELIPDDSIGYVVDPDDPEAVGGVVNAVLGSSETEAAERRARARAYIAEHFSSDKGMRRYADAWRQKLKGSAQRR